MSQHQQPNLLAMHIIENVRKFKRAKDQVNVARLIISNVFTNNDITFSKTLTYKEKLCLFWAAHGKTAKETASLMSIKFTTVDSHRKEIKRKLKSKNMAHAVFKGILCGYTNKKTWKKLD